MFALGPTDLVVLYQHCGHSLFSVKPGDCSCLKTLLTFLFSESRPRGFLKIDLGIEDVGLVDKTNEIAATGSDDALESAWIPRGTWKL